jgi:hypothetical protein
LPGAPSKLEANPELTHPIAHQVYLPTPVVFATGVAHEAEDLACRITHMSKALFA